jgi:hypothetical protein
MLTLIAAADADVAMEAGRVIGSGQRQDPASGTSVSGRGSDQRQEPATVISGRGSDQGQ